MGCEVVAPSEFGVELLVEWVVIVVVGFIIVVGAIVVAGAVEVGTRSLVVVSPHKSISVSNFTTCSIILGMSSWVRGTVSLEALCGDSSYLLCYVSEEPHHSWCFNGETLNTFSYSHSMLLVSRKYYTKNRLETMALQQLCFVWYDLMHVHTTYIFNHFRSTLTIFNSVKLWKIVGPGNRILFRISIS